MRADRHAFYARVRAVGAPVAQIDPGSGERLWIVARHADVREGLSHPALGHERAGLGVTRLERINARQLIYSRPPRPHAPARPVSRAFTPRTVAGLHERIEGIVDELLSGLGRARSTA